MILFQINAIGYKKFVRKLQYIAFYTTPAFFYSAYGRLAFCQDGVYNLLPLPARFSRIVAKEAKTVSLLLCDSA